MSEQDAENLPEQPARNGKRRRVLGSLLLLVLAGIFIGGWLWYRGQVEVSTDDAFVQAPTHLVAARVAGQVQQVLVADNQRVSKGQLLLTLDPAPYQARFAAAEARLAMARNQTSGDYAQIGVARAAVTVARAAREQADKDQQRGAALFAREVIPREQLEHLQTAATVTAARLLEAQQRLKQALAAVAATPSGGLDALVAQRTAELETARLNRSYTQLTAPTDGYVTRKTVEPGNIVQPGQPLLILVQLDHPWVVANYKESQLTHVRPGQPVRFTVDAYPGQTFSGRVDSLMAGTGAAFSLLPPENASGNYVKVVQRVPLKILIDPDSDPQQLLRVGMSVQPAIDTGLGLREALAELNPFR